jgi:multiple antibiotic resistance protein
MTERYLQAFVTVLSLINPAICGLMFGASQAGRSGAQRRAAATGASVAILVILSLTALFGARVLKTFGISLDAFSVAGGLVLMHMGFGMLRGAAAAAPGDGAPARGTLTPLVLFAASPGTMTGVITLAVAHSGSGIPVTTLVAVAGAVALTWLVMIVLPPGRPNESSLARSTVQAVMGLVVIAMGVQFGLSALQDYFKA